MSALCLVHSPHHLSVSGRQTFFFKIKTMRRAALNIQNIILLLVSREYLPMSGSIYGTLNRIKIKFSFSSETKLTADDGS